MKSIKVIIYLLFCFAVGLANAHASQINDAKECTSVSNPNDRLKCFDQVFSKNTEPSESKSISSGLSAVNAVMEEILAIPLQKGEFETTEEFRNRVLNLYAKYDAKTYVIDLNIKDHSSDRSKLAKYNPDTELLMISMPSLDFVTVGLQMSPEPDDKQITLSFIETKSLDQDISKYTARNRLGAEVEVVKAVFRDIGLAILGESNRDMDGQSFSVKVPRNNAKSILQNGKVRITVKIDLIKNGNNSFLLDNWMTFMSKGAFILISEKDEREPTMTDPRHVVREKAMLPVRLLSMSLIDDQGREVKSVNGSQISTSYFNR